MLIRLVVVMALLVKLQLLEPLVISPQRQLLALQQLQLVLQRQLLAVVPLLQQQFLPLVLLRQHWMLVLRLGPHLPLLHRLELDQQFLQQEPQPVALLEQQLGVMVVKVASMTQLIVLVLTFGPHRFLEHLGELELHHRQVAQNYLPKLLLQALIPK